MARGCAKMQPPSCQGLLLLLWAGVAHSTVHDRRTPGESCSDVPLWKDSEGYNCSQYQSGRWCTSDGNLGTGWQARWNVMETYWHDGYTAISACCACGGGQVSHINGLWQVMRGPCTIEEECILSPNYPGNYSDNERCTILVNSTLAKPLKTIHWDVEYWFDYLHISGTFYSGRNDPQGVVPAGSIQWSADEDTHGTGWKLCASDEALTTTTAGVAEITEAATTSEPSTSSSTSPEPSVPAEPTTCRDVEGWTDLSDYPCADYVEHGWCTSTGAKGPNWADAWGEFDDYWRNGYAAPQACCACGGGQVHSVVGAWQVLHGACTIVDNCIQSPNYPANYSSNGRCAIVTNSSFMAPLQLVDFSTERFYDILTINNMPFSGLRKPSGVTPRGTIAWISDEDIEAKGWKLCLGPKPSPPAGGGIFSILEGPCTMDAEGCAVSPNYPSHYGSLQGCIIQVYNPENKTISAKDFVTEASYDVLWVNGRRYSGSSGPDGVVPRGPIQWSPDEDVEDKGWKLCPGPVGQPEEGPSAAEQGYYGDFGYGDDVSASMCRWEVEVNGTLPFGKILLATAALCLTGVASVKKGDR
ncbi:unnamed protein product [Symbiodinium sp. KB8]|nr:unnamed protein product [Symbiodinium sp. KB8]